MIPIQHGAEKYLQMRHALGFRTYKPGLLLRQFISFLEQERSSYITMNLALRWAKLPSNTQPAWWATRLTIVRQFARHWSATDPRTEIPPLGLLPHRPRRRMPYQYTDAQVAQLIKTAKQLLPNPPLRPWTYSTLFGLLAVTGLRISEALALNLENVDLNDGVLLIHKTKFGKSRLIPIHASTKRALREYARRREQIRPKLKHSAFFVSSRGGRLSQDMARYTFVRLSCQIGLRGPSDRSGPCLHDFRHRFAVRTLLRWYRARLDVEQKIPLLSTYLGHTHVADTYWYLSAAPELLALAAARLKNTLGDLP